MLVVDEDRWPVLQGNGFELRVLRHVDAEVWKAGEDPEQIRWFEAPGPSPIENIVAAIDGWRSNWSANGPVRHWGIWTDDGLSGGVEVRVRDDGKANISYVVFPAARRRHLATESVSLVSTWALERLDVVAIVAVVGEDNVASRGVAASAGFVLDGRAEPWEHGESGVMLRYVRTR